MKAPPIPLAEAQDRLLALAQPLDPVRLPIGECPGRYLAEDLLARRTQPAAEMSAMDGFALRSADLTGPWKIIGESAAGSPFLESVRTGEAVRISTGAVLPAGANCVLVQEDCERHGDTLTLTGAPPKPPGRHIRAKGNDFASGQMLLSKGERIGPAQVALAIAAGHCDLTVSRRVELTVIDSGSELVQPGEAATDPHRLPASNGAMLVAMTAGLPCNSRSLGPVRDDLELLARALESAADADIIVTSGGASVGDHDLLIPALEAIGATIEFWRVAVKPGKPLLVARRGRQIILGLPGNPVSAYVTAHLFLLPLLRAMARSARPITAPIVARLEGELPPGGPRMQFLRGFWDGESVRIDAVQDSGALLALARSNALVRHEIDAPAVPKGGKVWIDLLENGGFA